MAMKEKRREKGDRGGDEGGRGRTLVVESPRSAVGFTSLMISVRSVIAGPL